ncbi:MAG TPA: hypothetical protein VKU41_12790 [Polyangiaceae bacterium]|nr:hypothetical protein [Polyangiaceae bacterium]
MPAVPARRLAISLALWPLGCAGATEHASTPVPVTRDEVQPRSTAKPSPEILDVLQRTAPRGEASSVVRASYDASNPPSRGAIYALCARDSTAGLELCRQLAPGDPSECAQVCLDDYRLAHQPAPAPAPAASAATASPAMPRAYPYVVALGDCIRRVRDGDDTPACRFLRPLDAMDFGQRHCDAKCRELTEGYRAAHAAP